MILGELKGQLLIGACKLVSESLKIIPAEVIQHNIDSFSSGLELFNSDLNNIWGISIYSHDDVWDESACGSNLIIGDNGKVVRALKLNDCKKTSKC